MKYYVIIVAVNAIFFLLKWRIEFLILAEIEVYIFICSYSLYVECMTSFPEDGGNTTENTVIRYEHSQSAPPPSYESCVDVPAE